MESVFFALDLFVYLSEGVQHTSSSVSVITVGTGSATLTFPFFTCHISRSSEHKLKINTSDVQLAFRPRVVAGRK